MLLDFEDGLWLFCSFRLFLWCRGLKGFEYVPEAIADESKGDQADDEEETIDEGHIQGILKNALSEDVAIFFTSSLGVKEMRNHDSFSEQG